MQTFRTTAAPADAHNRSTIDFMHFPSPADAEQLDTITRIRVPLLPDNYSPNRAQGTGQEVETLDGPLMIQEIRVIAAHPQQVLPSAMTEVVGNEAMMDDVRLGMAYEADPEENQERGMLGQIWGGLVDDIFGQRGAAAAKPAM